MRAAQESAGSSTHSETKPEYALAELRVTLVVVAMLAIAAAAFGAGWAVRGQQDGGSVGDCIEWEGDTWLCSSEHAVADQSRG